AGRRFPLHRPPAGGSRAGAERRGALGGERRLTAAGLMMQTILVVEDNELSRDALSRRLERRGYRVLLAVDGEQAVSIGRAELPDLILMDLGLPRVDGWEATRRLKADAATQRIP